MSNGNNEMTRSETITYRVTAGDVGIVDASFKVYPGTEMVYGQVINAAITKALTEMSLKAAEIVAEMGDDAPEKMALESILNKAVL